MEEKGAVMTAGAAQISVRGKWVTVPAIEIGGKSIIVTGRWPRIARVRAEEWLESELDDPPGCVERLRSASDGLHADIFTFGQKVPDVSPKYNYTMEPESVAVADVRNFK